MSDIKYEIAVKQDQVQEEISAFRRLFGKVAGHSIFQFRHFDLIKEGYELCDFIFNDDITETLLNKMKDLQLRIEEALDDPDFKQLIEDSIEISKIRSKVSNKKN